MYRDDVAALAARRTALQAEVAHKQRELDSTAQLLDEARGARRLPVLDNIAVASPCKASWADMAGDDRVRHCGDCKKHVYNLSDMTRDEAEALIFAHEGRLCVRYVRRADGTILFGDCWVGAQRRRRIRIAAIATAAATALGAFATKAGTELMRLNDLDRSEEVMLGEYQTTVGSLALPLSESVERSTDEREVALDEARAVLREVSRTRKDDR